MADSTSIQRILMIRPTALGDVCRTVPCLAALRQAFPQAQIDWLVHRHYIPAIQAHPALHQAVAFDRSQLAHWYARPQAVRELGRFLSNLRRAHYDLTIDLQGLARSGFFAWMTGASQRWGYANARELGWLGYNRRASIDRRMHSVDRMLSLLEAFGVPCLASPDMRLYVPPQAQAWRPAFLKQEQLTQGQYAILAPTAQWKCKCWPIQRYLQLAQRMLAERRWGERLVILAARHEQPLIQPLLDGLGSRAVWPTSDVGQMMSLIEGCRLMICNDSAPLHMAVGFDRPVIALFGPTDPALVGPYRQRDAVVEPTNISSLRQDGAAYRHRRDDQSLMARIDLQTLWQRVLETT